MAQLGARLNGIEKVEGSNPSGSTDEHTQGFSLSVNFNNLYNNSRSSRSSDSELGQLGGSPIWFIGKPEIELACSDVVSVNSVQKIAGTGTFRYHE